MTPDEAYTRALANLQGLVQKLGTDTIGPVYMQEITELETDWNERHSIPEDDCT